MADLKVSGRMKVKSLKASFKKAFGVNLRVYKGKKFADDDATLASIRSGSAGGGEFSINGKTHVGNVEKNFKKEFGINVQVEDKGGDLADNKISLTKAGK